MFNFIRRIFRTIWIIICTYRCRYISWRLGTAPDMFNVDTKVLLKELEELEWSIHERTYHEDRDG